MAGAIQIVVLTNPVRDLSSVENPYVTPFGASCKDAGKLCGKSRQTYGLPVWEYLPVSTELVSLTGNSLVGARLCLAPFIPTGSTCQNRRREAQPRTNRR